MAHEGEGGYILRMHVVATASLPIDLAAHLRAALPDTTCSVPAAGHVGIAHVDLTTADALVCLLLDKIDASVLARAPQLKVVANCAVGVDNLDLEALAARGVAVTNTPDVLTEATAELAFTLMLAAARRLGEAERLVRSGEWTGWALDQLLGVQLYGKTLGIVGFGRIGRAMARRGEGFGMHVIHASSRDPAAVDALFAVADVISLHCPLTPATRHLVDARRLALVKPTAVLVNTARGGCVDAAAVAEALQMGRLFGAGLDVYEDEPAIDPRLVACERAVLAPHIGSATTETRIRMATLCADGVIAVLTGQTPPNLVRP